MQEHETRAEASTEEASRPFVGQWNDLVSTTNWDKGRIILDLRASTVARAARRSHLAALPMVADVLPDLMDLMSFRGVGDGLGLLI